MVLQHNRFVCSEAAENVIGYMLFQQLQKGSMRAGGRGILTGSFDLFLCGFVPQVYEAEDSIVILILKEQVRSK